MIFQNAKLKIYRDFEEVDWFNFHQGYSPLLSQEARNLYMAIVFQKRINQHIGVEAYDMTLFLKNSNISERKFKEAFAELEKLNLAQMSVKSKMDKGIELLVKVNRLMPLRKLIKHSIIGPKLKEALSREKYSELLLITEEKELEFEISVGKEENLFEKESEGILDKETYCLFYNEVFKMLGEEFTFNDDVLRLIKEHHVDKKELSMKKICEFSFISIQAKGNKRYISAEHFSFLINKELNKNESKVDKENHHDFWKKLIYMSDYEIKKKFNELFTKCECEEMYKRLTSRSEVPVTLSKWIKDCIQNKNFSFPILNATISFVKTLLKKVPVKYLTKVSDTLIENNAVEFDMFIQHIQNVIQHDYKNKNRLNIQEIIPTLSYQFEDKDKDAVLHFK